MTTADDHQDAVLKLQTLWLHEGPEHINALQWSCDDSLIAAAYADGSVAVLETKAGKQLWQAHAHGMDASVVQWSPDSQWLATAGQSNGVILWNAREGTVAHRLDCGKGWVEHLSWGPDGLLACACGPVITLWSTQGTLVQRFEPCVSTVTGLQWMPGGRLFSSCYGMVNQWSANHSTPRRFYPWKDSLLNLAISPDERFIASGCQDSSVHLWRLKSGADFQMSGYPAKVRHGAWSHDSQYFATASAELVVVWSCSGDGPEKTKPLMLPVHAESVTALAFSHRDQRLVSGSSEGLVFVIDLEHSEPLAGLHNVASIGAIAWNHNDQVVAIGDGLGRLQICAVPLMHH
ncbi:WD40 repeat domain-containing protein [Pseudomonas huanghezhanensis]|uniref:WD40 repeat domain-containing protein n=1 Tax=Pseudomonas huanghezhanensis TaxID=3002903 RepID=UPI002285451F|nr:hypothetical protein [Pseudomonas sp. BSw22131]